MMAGIVEWIAVGLLVYGGAISILKGISRMEREIRPEDIKRLRGMLLSCSMLWSLQSAVMDPPSAIETNLNSHWLWMLRNSAFILWYIYLLVCSVTDHLTCYVYNFTHYPALLAGILYWYTSRVDKEAGGAILFYALVHGLLFSKLFGRGDCLVFVISAFFLTRTYDNAEWYLYHMALTFLLLGVVSFMKGNINKRGNLKRPAALVPYIMTAAWIMGW